VRIISVDPPIEPGFLRGMSTDVFDEIMKQQRADVIRRLDDAAAILAKNAPGLPVTTSLLEGWPKDAIVAEAERWRADLIVVGSHGYGPLRRFFLGSVSLYVALHAPCSVEIVRSQPPSPSNPMAASSYLSSRGKGKSRMVAVVMFLAGLGLLVAGAELVVRGASHVATMLGVRPMISGLTIVSIGTSAPELAVGIVAGLQGTGALAVGNIAGKRAQPSLHPR
jgi:nucleotide-binding universal stress UspA family protein